MQSMVLTTVKSLSEGRKIGRFLIKGKLAACVNILPRVESLFWWKGKIDNAREVLLIIKTNKRKVKSAIRAIKLIHSYEVPEIISFEINEGYRPYLRWIDESLR